MLPAPRKAILRPIVICLSVQPGGRVHEKLPEPGLDSMQLSPSQHSRRVSQLLPSGTHWQVSSSPQVEAPQQSMSLRQRLPTPAQH